MNDSKFEGMIGMLIGGSVITSGIYGVLVALNIYSPPETWPIPTVLILLGAAVVWLALKHSQDEKSILKRPMEGLNDE